MTRFNLLRRAIWLGVLLSISFALVACGGAAPEEPTEPAEEEAAGGEEMEEPAEEAEEPVRVALVINGTLGDLGFFDSADSGVQRAAEDFNIEATTIEASYDTNKWEPALVDAANGPYDVIIAGTFNMKEIMERIAPQFPEKQFILFDVSADFEACNCDNIYGIVYRYNEAGYLAGALAAKLTAADLPRSNPDLAVGFVGGMDIPVIQNFYVGYEKGVADTNPDVEIVTAYAGDFNDPARGKQLTEEMVDQGVDVVWSVAGATGLGVYEGALDREIYAIAVNENQTAQLIPNDEAYGETIVTAPATYVGESLYIALERYMSGTMQTGENVTLGVAEGVIALEDNEYYQNIVPASIREEMDQITDQIKNGEIEIPSVST